MLCGLIPRLCRAAHKRLNKMHGQNSSKQEEIKGDHAPHFGLTSSEGAAGIRQALEHLSRRMTSCWSRRGHKLLELYCADGYFLEMFWQSGFDVSGQEQDPALLAQARLRLKNTAEFSQARPHTLPYDDRSFDYVVCLTGLATDAEPLDLVGEMFRLATHGVLLAFPCSWSMHGLGRAFRRKAKFQKLFSPLQISSLISQADESGSGKSNWAATLPGPAWAWKSRRLAALNSLILPMPLGALGMVRVDFNPPLGASSILVPGQRSFKRETVPSSFGSMRKGAGP